MINDFKRFFAVIIVLFIVSCDDSPIKRVSTILSEETKSESKKETKDESFLKKLGEKRKDIKAFSKIASNSEKTIDQMNILAEMEPVTHSSLKSWLPENIDNYKRTFYSTGEMAAAGVISFKSKFTNQEEKDKVVQIEVIDGAGSSIAGMFISSLQRSFDAEIEEETEESYKKIVERKGLKAMEEQNDKYKKSSLQFVRNNRFHIKLEGKNITVDELWKMAEKLNTEKLNQL